MPEWLLVETYCIPIIAIAPPEVKELCSLLNMKVIEWEVIGRELGVSQSHLETIRKEADLLPSEKLKKVILEWRESQCSDVSWDNIKEVFKRLGGPYNSLAKEVERKYLS